MQPFKPTHRIETVKRVGATEHKEVFVVMLVGDGSAYTKAEWDECHLPSWEHTDAGEWRYSSTSPRSGEQVYSVGAFDEVTVTPLDSCFSLDDSLKLLADALDAAREHARAGDTMAAVCALREVEAGAKMVADAAEQTIKET